MDLSHHLVDTITVRKLSGHDGRGRPVWAEPAREVKCRIEQHSERIMGPDGTEVTTIARIGTHTEITIDDFIWQPGADTDDVSQANKPARRPEGTTLSGSPWFEVLL